MTETSTKELTELYNYLQVKSSYYCANKNIDHVTYIDELKKITNQLIQIEKILESRINKALNDSNIL